MLCNVLGLWNWGISKIIVSDAPFDLHNDLDRILTCPSIFHYCGLLELYNSQIETGSLNKVHL
jgi:hypothetical protein